MFKLLGDYLHFLVDMSFYWIHQDKGTGKVCLGYGPYPDADQDCARQLANGFTFKEMTLGGAGASVFYSYGKAI